jgi:hypothetical protein
MVSVMRGILTLVPVLALLLAGCAPTSAQPSGGPPASASATPPSTALTAPRAALPLSCEGVISTAHIQAALKDPISAKVTESTAPRTVQDVALQQAGGTICVWGGATMTDSGYDSGLTLRILPHAAAGFSTWKSSRYFGSQAQAGIGDDFGYQCDREPADECGGDILVGGYWVSLQLSALDTTSITRAGFLDIAAQIADAVAKAPGPRDNWTPPTGSFSGGTRCAATPGIGNAVTAGPYPDIDMAAALSVSAVRLSCPAADDLDIEVIPAGSWAFAPLVDAAPLWFMIGTPARVEIRGASGAAIACDDACESVLDYRGSFVFVGDHRTTDLAAATLRLQQLITSLG